MKSDSELVNVFREAVWDLLFMSEIDAPFEVILWDKTPDGEITVGALLKFTGHKGDEYIEETKLETLFSTPTMDQDWHSPEDKKRVMRFRALQECIIANLKELKVFRVGRINIEVFILGRTPSGNILCVSTKQLQT